jgi:hypothetical protein
VENRNSKRIQTDQPPLSGKVRCLRYSGQICLLVTYSLVFRWIGMSILEAETLRKYASAALGDFSAAVEELSDSILSWLLML